MSRFARSPLTAVLGPTNTGKTHLAVERMLGHSSGMMGFPLRLLAREVYDRVVAAKGPNAAALVTGEEQIWPEGARYLLCTAEAMPWQGRQADGQDVAFVAIDEAQLGQDRDRGHVFTTRLLHARGREETMILGSGALTPVVRDLVPEAEIITRPRFSTLSYDGPKKLQRLPPRSAIVAFSAEEVYAIAEALRRLSGGAAVVMGALSPSTRNAQVAMFQAGEVDYLVATDAIGMGLNLDVAHVAFAGLSKFDGQRQRRLTAAELAQIAGRAGRHQRDGTFGSVGGEPMFTDEEVAAIEGHHFPPVESLFWRNPQPSTDSIAALIADLEVPPPHPRLRPAPEAIDLAVLRQLADDPAIQVADPAAVARLWSACSLPDFTKSGAQAHARFVARLWEQLGTGNGHLDADWYLGRLRALDQIDGAVEVLADRIAQVRTWCYIAHRADWLADPVGMAEQARGVEQRLSDALHAALTARFVDRRTSVLLRAIGSGVDLPVTVEEDGTVRVEGEALGMLEGFAFRVDPSARASDHRMLLAAAERHLVRERAVRAMALASAADAELALDLTEGHPPGIRWRGVLVATLARGKSRLAPRIVPVRSVSELDAHQLAAITARLDQWVDAQIGDRLARLIAIGSVARDAATPPAMRALLAALLDNGGVIVREEVDASLKQLDPEQRQQLRAMQISTGSLDLFAPALLKPAAQRWRAGLHAAWTGQPTLPPPPPGITLIDQAPGGSGVTATDFRAVGSRWLRIDMVEQMARHAHNARMAQERSVAADSMSPQPTAVEAGTDASATLPEAQSADRSGRPPQTPFAIDPALGVSLGLTAEERVTLLRLLGFRPQLPLETPEADQLWRWRGRQPKPKRGRGRPFTPKPSGERAEGKRPPRQPAIRGPIPTTRRPAAHAAGQRESPKSGGNRGMKPTHGASPSGARHAPSPHSPFAALAGLFDKPGKDGEGE